MQTHDKQAFEGQAGWQEDTYCSVERQNYVGIMTVMKNGIVKLTCRHDLGERHTDNDSDIIRNI